MIALTFVSLLLLTIVGCQYLFAPHSAHRLAVRRLQENEQTISVDAGAALVSALTRRTRAASIGGAVGAVGATIALWLVIAEPTGSPGLLPIAIVLAAVVVASVGVEVVHVTRTTPAPPAGVRVAGLQSREPHLSRREAAAENAFIVIAGLALALAALAWWAGVEHAAAATTCAAAAVLTIAATALTRRWVLARPVPAGSTDDAVSAELLTTATADRFTENLLSNGLVLLLYVAIVIAPGLDAVGVAVAIALLAVTAWVVATASTARRRAQRSAVA
ncbi:hypothetical protein ACHAAC_02005 [Aeromicrobium sp. CF4.19]|uniref:hypothetical protein n=1 Tax=Aeromicrobium sp. CF4.19 TaxID=3373082 RepID=UPI003EE63F74